MASPVFECDIYIKTEIRCRDDQRGGRWCGGELHWVKRTGDGIGLLPNFAQLDKMSVLLYHWDTVYLL